MIERDDQSTREALELAHWEVSYESPHAEFLPNLVNKMTDAPILIDCLKRFRSVFKGPKRILELGAGMGWAACIVKRMFPRSYLIATDISEAALSSLPQWERVLDVKVDKSVVSKSYEIPEDDRSLDCIYTFASAHHFGAHRRTLMEISRVLKGGGHCFYFYEPSCLPIWHGLAKWRVNKKRPDVPEDVLIYPNIKALAWEFGLTCDVYFYPDVKKRAPIEMLYYGVLNAVPYLQKWFPCTANYHFVKRLGRTEEAG